MKKIIYTLAIIFISNYSFGQFISIDNQSTIYSENFNLLSTSGTTQTLLPTGWWINENPGNTTYRAGDGASNSGDTYSFGTGTNTERSIGGLGSGSVSPNFGVKYINNSGASFTSFSINMFMEQWRSGGRTVLDSLYFYYSVNNGIDTAGTARIVTRPWTRVPACDLVSKITQATAAALDGNLSANRKYYQFTVTGLTVSVGDTLWLRWQDPNVGGNDDGLSIDDYSFTVNATLPVKYTQFTADRNNDNVKLNWSTASEVNNNGFEIERSSNGTDFEKIGFVKGVGNSSRLNKYSFTDKNNSFAYYRLKQVDFDGKYEFSKVLTVKSNESSVELSPNPFNDNLVINSNTTIINAEIVDITGRVKMFEVVNSNTAKLNTSGLDNGVYFIRINNGEKVITKRIIKN